MVSPRSRRLRTPTAFVTYLAICGVGAVVTLPAVTGCSSEAEAKEEEPQGAEQAIDEAQVPVTAVQRGTAAVDGAVDPRPSLAPLVQRVTPAVVSIHAFGKPIDAPSIFGRPRGRGSGSGFVIEDGGIVVTNHHVVSDAERLEVHLPDGRVFDAELLGSDPATDLAVISCKEATGLPTTELGSSEDLQVGDWVVAIGSPMGLEHSATIGILSGRGRGSLGLYPDSYIDFLQTDADIAPGSSGGPLFDLSGKVVGITTAVGADRGPGFAIPIDQARSIIASLKGSGEVVRGWLGAASDPGADQGSGAVIGTVYGGTPADDAGLRPGDVVVRIDGHEVGDFEGLRARIATLQPGHTVLMEVLRDGQTVELAAVLQERPEGQALRRLREKRHFADVPARAPAKTKAARLGVQAKPHPDGVEVVTVERGSLAEDLELRPGDVIVAVGGKSVSGPEDVQAALEENTDRIEVEIVREGVRQRVVFSR